MAKKNEVVASEESTSVVAFDTSKLKLKQRLVVPSISLKKMKEGDTLYFKAESEISEKQASDDETGEPKVDEKGKPQLLHVMNITRLDTGEFGQIVVGAIAARGFKDAGVLTGRMFAMQKGEETRGKATKWNVVEIEEA